MFAIFLSVIVIVTIFFIVIVIITIMIIILIIYLMDGEGGCVNICHLPHILPSLLSILHLVIKKGLKIIVFDIDFNTVNSE